MDEMLDGIEGCTVVHDNTLDLLSALCEEACLKEMTFAAERPLEESDVAGSKDKSEKYLNCLNNFISNCFVPKGYSNMRCVKQKQKNALASVLVLCAEHSNTDCLWTTDETMRISLLIVDRLCQFCDCNTPKDLINCHEIQLIPDIFKILRPKLETETWKLYPAAVSSYYWFIHQIEMPSMGNYLHLVMPTTLIILEDYLSANRVIGLSCLKHVVENLTTSEFTWYCPDDSLYRTLYPMIYNMEPATLKPLISCLVAVLSKKISKVQKLKWTYFDDIMDVWLPAMEMEQKLDLRAAHIETLPIFLEAMGLACVRWSSKLLAIFEDYATFSQEQEKCFNAMHTFILQTWPRTDKHLPQLIVILLKTLYDITENEENDYSKENEEIIHSIVQCLNLLRSITPEKMGTICSNFKDCSSFNNILKGYL